MDSGASEEVAHDFRPFFRVFKDGRVEKYKLFDQIKPVPAGLDPETGIETKDVVLSPETGVSARVFVRKTDGGPDRKLPLLVHYHGGGFCAGSPFDTASKGFLSTMVSRANVIAISIDYRLAPENPLPIAYEDSFEALKWIGATRMDLARNLGESAGANIGQYVAARAGAASLAGVRIKGMLIVHPFFGGKEVDEMYKFMCPTSSGLDDDPKLNPAVDPDLPKTACEKVLVCVAEKDWLRNRGVKYYEALCGSGWKGKAELEEAKDEGHCFHLFSKNERAEQLINKMVDFITKD
ncbi:hypothetical protein BT93_C0446 [Corymbia citriodora subsp. variegata]|nr:hypothetical protein BT93_C0446 [Corymbia citriodora subsp. variegata]